jgi:hypothetical protein
VDANAIDLVPSAQVLPRVDLSHHESDEAHLLETMNQHELEDLLGCVENLDLMVFWKRRHQLVCALLIELDAPRVLNYLLIVKAWMNSYLPSLSPSCFFWLLLFSLKIRSTASANSNLE